MHKPASKDVLADLHSGFAAYLLKLLNEAVTAMTKPEAGLPLDAATMNVIARFLKDNSVTFDPADNDTLSKLREQYSKAQQGVSGAAGAAVRDAMQDDDVQGYPMQ